MIRVILNGCNGRMGKMISETIDVTDDMAIVAGIDARAEDNVSYPVYDDPDNCVEDADVVIDFSTAAAADGIIRFALNRHIPLVLCTTGLSEDQEIAAVRASKSIAVLRSSNMSVGVNVLMEALKSITPALLRAGFDVEIVEKHHNQKLDSPSGTALSLADTLRDSADWNPEYVYDRSMRREKRPKDEIGISAVRGGTIVGDHDVIFAGKDEVVTFSHRAYSRAIFAEGAIAAARFLSGRENGMYSMSDVISGE